MIELPLYTISSRAHSTTLPLLHAGHYNHPRNILQGVLFDFFIHFDKIFHMEKTFNEKVYDTVARIPAGRVATFGQIAQIIGRPRMARFVGYASNNKNSWHLPWHRVVFKDGSLCCGMATEQYRALKSEGVKFDQDKRVIMSEYQWDPERDGVPLDLKDLPLVF